MTNNITLRLGGVRVGFTGLTLPIREHSFLPQFSCGGAADATLHIYQDADGALSTPVIYEDAFYRVHASDGKVSAEVSAHGTLKTWGYAILHYDAVEPRLQLLSPTHSCTLDQVLSGMMMESLLLARGHAVLHASAIRVGSQAILFTAPSGTGKSTQAELWNQYRGAEVLNGDKTLLYFENGTAMAGGLPYAGTSGICKRFDLPIRAIVVLRQAKEDRRTELRPAEAVRCLLSQIVLQPWSREDVQSATELALRMAESVPIVRLDCLPEESAVACLERSLK